MKQQSSLCRLWSRCWRIFVIRVCRLSGYWPPCCCNIHAPCNNMEYPLVPCYLSESYEFDMELLKPQVAVWPRDLENDSNGRVEDDDPSSSSSSSKLTVELDITAPPMVSELQPPECQEFDSEPGWHPAIHKRLLYPRPLSFLTMY